ncbi:MAG TPA: glucose 1-dehydrogenase [Roseiflexaceae bacterium]|nr:glucose 1-dehydrogenase [Roseiflexaceae bacterium]
MELQGKVAVVTGAARGIGAAVARVFAREGAAVVIVDLDGAAARAVADEIGGAGGRALAVQADVSRAADAQRIAMETVAAFGGIDVLVNNAGIQTYGTVETMPEEEWDRTLNVNLKSVFLVSKYAVPEIRRRGGGAIVNIASVQALATQPAVSAYAASKGGIVSMTRSMALDFAADNIRVNCVCPGSVDTPMLRWAADLFGGGDAEGAVRAWGKLHALGRVARAEEIAEVVLFLASPRSSFCTGAAYLADGGMLASFS